MCEVTLIGAPLIDERCQALGTIGVFIYFHSYKARATVASPEQSVMPFHPSSSSHFTKPYSIGMDSRRDLSDSPPAPKSGILGRTIKEKAAEDVRKQVQKVEAEAEALKRSVKERL